MMESQVPTDNTNLGEFEYLSHNLAPSIVRTGYRLNTERIRSAKTDTFADFILSKQTVFRLSKSPSTSPKFWQV